MTVTGKRSKRNGQAGSVSVEMVFVLPLYTLIWLLGNHAFLLYTGVIDNVAAVRDCAWQFADSGCLSRPAACTATGPLPAPPPDGASGTELRQVGTNFPFLRESLSGPEGMSLTIRKMTSIAAPPLLNFRAIRTTALYGAMCDEKPLPPWTTLEIYELACRRFGKFC